MKEHTRKARRTFSQASHCVDDPSSGTSFEAAVSKATCNSGRHKHTHGCTDPTMHTHIHAHAQRRARTDADTCADTHLQGRHSEGLHYLLTQESDGGGGPLRHEDGRTTPQHGSSVSRPARHHQQPKPCDDTDSRGRRSHTVTTPQLPQRAAHRQPSHWQPSCRLHRATSDSTSINSSGRSGALTVTQGQRRLLHSPNCLPPQCLHERQQRGGVITHTGPSKHTHNGADMCRAKRWVLASPLHPQRGQ